MQGRPNTPTVTKKLQGTDRADRILPNEMSPEPLQTLPQPPPQLKNDEMAKQVWIETTVELEALKMLTTVDMQVLAAYCREISRYWKAQIKLDAEGEVITSHNGYPMPILGWVFPINHWIGPLRLLGNLALPRLREPASALRIRKMSLMSLSIG